VCARACVRVLKTYQDSDGKLWSEKAEWNYGGRKITESLGNVTARGKDDGKSKGGARWPPVCLSLFSITENIYCSQLSSVTIFLQPEPNCFTSYSTRKGLCCLPLCAIVLRSPPSSHVSTCNGQRSSQLFCVLYTVVGAICCYLYERRYRCSYCSCHWYVNVWLCCWWRRVGELDSSSFQQRNDPKVDEESIFLFV
jgi:hypothetical protein